MKTQKWILPITTISLFLSFSITCFAFEKEIKTMASALSESVSQAGRKTIAVVDFNDLQGNVTELGRFFAEEFSVALASAGKEFEVVDRNNLKTILIEHKLSTTGIIDPLTARKLGQIAGVDALISGTITPFGDTVRLTVKILDTNTAKVIGATSGDIAKTKAIDELLEKGIEENSISKNVSSTKKSQQSQSQDHKSLIKSNTNDFTFELKQCKLSGTKLTCEALIINNDKDRRLTVFGEGYVDYSRIIDNKGFEYKAKKFQLGSSISSGHWTGNEITVTMVTGIPTLIKFTFENISDPPESIALLDIVCMAEGINGNFRGQLRNIPIEN